MSGIRKSKKQYTLQNLSDRYHLNISDIDTLSCSQLSKMILKIKDEHGIKRRKNPYDT